MPPAAGMRVDDWLARAAEALPERPALVAGDRSLTFAELESEARRAARRLAGARRRAGATGWRSCCEPSPEHVVLAARATKLGAVAVPLDPRAAGAGERPAGWARSSRRWSCATRRGRWTRPSAADAALEPRWTPTTSHCVIHTSGTGGRAERRRADLRQPPLERDRRGRADRRGAHRPLALLPAAAPHRRAVDRAALRALPASRSCSSPSTPRDRRAPIEAERRHDRVARADDARAPARRGRAARSPALRPDRRRAGPQSLIERALDAGAPVAPTYGLTETASQVATMPPGEARERPGSAGPPILSTEVRIDDEGRICVRGPTSRPGARATDGWLAPATSAASTRTATCTCSAAPTT